MKTITNNGKNSISIQTAITTEWDVVIVGAGMGGAASAYSLANAGHKVLLLEKGMENPASEDTIAAEIIDPAERIQSGRWPTKITGVVDGRKIDMWPTLGTGAGGSTLLYAAALSRFRPVDLEVQKKPDGSSVQWPFSYATLVPYYQRIEKLFSVRGTDDPLQPDPDFDMPPPEPMCERDAFFFKAFNDGGLNAHNLHSGIAYKENCNECLGKICPQSCKSDANNCLLQPAFLTNNLFLCAETEAIKLNANETSVASIVVEHARQRYEIQGKIFIVAAGALFSPALLLKSQSEIWPNGLANSNDLVGRNLMFHADNYIAFWAKRNLSRTGPQKTIVARDFYSYENKKYGEFQSTALTAGYANVIYTLRQMFDASVFRKLTPIRHLLRIPAFLAGKLFGEAAVFVTLIEDYAYSDNRVMLDNESASGVRFEYTVRPELRERAKTFKKLILERTKKVRSLPMNKDLMLNYGHASGTCKAGTNPETSVLNADCRTHEVDNLYITDSSFMPSSAGTNPSLTIAANALRVAEIIDKRLQE